MTEQRIITHKIFQGETFTAARGVNLGSGATANLAIENPDGSEKTLLVEVQEVKTDSAAIGTYYRSPDISGGTAADAANDMVGHTNDTVANVTHDATLANSSSTVVFPISETGGADGGLTERPPLAIPEGESIAIEVDSDAADNDVLFLVTYYESDR